MAAITSDKITKARSWLKRKAPLHLLKSRKPEALAAKNALNVIKHFELRAKKAEKALASSKQKAGRKPLSPKASKKPVPVPVEEKLKYHLETRYPNGIDPHGDASNFETLGVSNDLQELTAAIVGMDKHYCYDFKITDQERDQVVASRITDNGCKLVHGLYLVYPEQAKEAAE
jgi:hypothetical protein